MNLETRFETVIQNIDEHCFVLKLSDLSNLLRGLRDEANAEKNNNIAELLQHELDVLEIYPQSFVINPQTYKRRMPVFIDEYSEEKLKYYAARFSKSLNLQLKSRYGDILIDYQGEKKINNKYDVFCYLVPVLLDVARLAAKEKHDEYFYAIDKLARATELCLLYNKKDLLKQSIEETVCFLSGVGSIYSYRWAIETTNILLEVMNNSKMNSIIDKDIIQLALRKLDEARGFWLKAKDFQLHRLVCNCLVVWNQKLQQPIDDLNLEIGLSFELEAEHQQDSVEKTEGVKAGFLQMALQHYLRNGLTRKVSELKVKLRKTYLAREEKELKTIMTPVIIPEKCQQHIEQSLTLYRGLGSIESILKALANDSKLIIDVSDLYLKLEAQVMATIPIIVIDDGRMIVQTTEYEERKELEFGRQYCGRLELQSIFLLMPIWGIMKEKGLSLELLVQKYLDWDFYNSK